MQKYRLWLNLATHIATLQEQDEWGNWMDVAPQRHHEFLLNSCGIVAYTDAYGHALRLTPASLVCIRVRFPNIPVISYVAPYTPPTRLPDLSKLEAWE